MSIQWDLEKNDVIDSRKLELCFQLELKIKELLEKCSVAFDLEVVSHLKFLCLLCSFIHCCYCININGN